jgi:acetate kinase
LLENLVQLAPLASLHQPYNLAPIRVAREKEPGLPQVASFDTAFHWTNPEVVQAYAVPAALADKGIRRYAFHGLSYEYIASTAPQAAPAFAEGRSIVAHLGNGASLCGLHAGRSIASTMGFSALDGQPMGTSCGEMDPAVVRYLLPQEGMTGREVENLLSRCSGMLGMSGISSDFRELLTSSEPRAHFAIEVFIHRVTRGIASLAAALGGLDGLAFTAGVGENAAPVRAMICEACAWLGVERDAEANAVHAACLTTTCSRMPAYIIPTNENLVIVRPTLAVLRN